jgi:hypothetical protein
VDLETVLVVLAVVLMVAVSGGLMLVNERVRAGEHGRIHEFNALLRRVGEAKSLSYHQADSHQHPLVGSVPAYGALSGRIRDLDVRVLVIRTDAVVHEDRIEVILEAGEPRAWPKVEGGFWSRGGRNSIANAGPGLTALGELADVIEVGGGRLRATPRCAPLGSSQHVVQHLYTKDEDLTRFVDLALKAADELAAG